MIDILMNMYLSEFDLVLCPYKYFLVPYSGTRSITSYNYEFLLFSWRTKLYNFSVYVVRFSIKINDDDASISLKNLETDFNGS